MKKIITCLLTIFLIASAAFSQNMSDLEKLVETEKNFAQTAREKSVKAAFLEYLHDDGLIFQPDAKNGKEVWKARPESPALLAWHPVWADISNDGRVGYTTGDWSFHPAGKDGEPSAFGQYITIWEKQTDGKFKAVLDIGISHEKPASVEKEWKSPKRFNSGKKKKEPNLMAENFEKHLAEDVRVYRNERFPFIGKTSGLEEIKKERTNIKTNKVLKEKCKSSGDFSFCYGEIEITKKDDSTEKGNSLQIWKLREGKWRMVLDLYTPIP